MIVFLFLQNNNNKKDITVWSFLLSAYIAGFTISTMTDNERDHFAMSYIVVDKNTGPGLRRRRPKLDRVVLLL